MEACIYHSGAKGELILKLVSQRRAMGTSAQT